MSETLFDAHLPYLEQAGWEPGTTWVPTVEQGAELNMRYQAELNTDYAQGFYFLDEDYDPNVTNVPQDPVAREKSVAENIVFLKMKADYNDRPLDRVITDMLTVIDMYGALQPDRYDASGATEREATSILDRVTGLAQSPTVGPEIIKLATRWAVIEHFMYHDLRGWTGESFEDMCSKAEEAGVLQDEFYSLLTTPVDQKAQALVSNNPSLDVVYANLAIIESKMLARAKETGLELTPLNAYSVYLNRFGH